MNVRFEGNNGRDADVMRCLLMTQACGDPSSLLQVTLSPGCMVIELGLNAKFAIDTLAPPPASAERLAPPCTTSLRGPCPTAKVVTLPLSRSTTDMSFEPSLVT